MATFILSVITIHLKVKMGVITNERGQPQHTDYKLRLLQDG